MILQLIKVRGPQPAIGRQPVVKLGQGLGPDAIEATLRVDACLDQSSLLQHPEVLGDGRLADAEPIYELPDRSLPVPENVQNRVPARLA